MLAVVGAALQSDLSLFSDSLLLGCVHVASIEDVQDWVCKVVVGI